MVDLIDFKKWLFNNTTYSKAVISDTVSRVKRANNLLTLDDDEMYQYKLERLDAYRSLSVSVRSQIKKSLKLYKEYEKMLKEKK